MQISPSHNDGNCHGRRVLLIHPGVEETRNRRHFPPWGIIFVAQALERDGHYPKVVDLNGNPNLEEATGHWVKVFEPNVVGVTGKWGHAARRAQRILEYLAQHHPKVMRVLGGPLVSLPLVDSGLFRAAHACLPGDGETSLLQWIKTGMPETRGGEPAQNADLSATWLDTPHLLDLSDYILPVGASDLNQTSLFISGSRGCVGKCTFCYTLRHAPAGLRETPPERLVDGIIALSARYGVNGFYFVDDCLVSRTSWRRRFCALLQDRPEPIRWGVDLRTGEASESVLRELWDGGCRALYMGLETIDSETFGQLGKATGSGTPLDAVDRAMAMGFTVRVSVVLGWPSETARSMKSIIQAVEERPNLLVDAFLYNPLPGTPIGDQQIPVMGSNHIYTDYGPGAPNLSSVSDIFLAKSWVRLAQLRDQRGWIGGDLRDFGKRTENE